MYTHRAYVYVRTYHIELAERRKERVVWSCLVSLPSVKYTVFQPPLRKWISTPPLPIPPPHLPALPGKTSGVLSVYFLTSSRRVTWSCLESLSDRQLCLLSVPLIDQLFSLINDKYRPLCSFYNIEFVNCHWWRKILRLLFRKLSFSLKLLLSWEN